MVADAPNSAVTNLPLRVGLIGVGRRGQGNFLPVLTCLRPEFSIAWIHARNLGHLEETASRWHVPTVAALDDDALRSVDVVAVTVPIDQNLVVLRKLQRHASRLIVVIDTPIAQSVLGAMAAAKLLAGFKLVLAAEDYMNFPEFDLARRVAEAGLIGALSHIELDGLGYRYHGLALLRSFADFAPIRSTRRQTLEGQCHAIHYRFGGGLSATVIVPYRRDDGTISITGSDGCITSSFVHAPYDDGGLPVHGLRIERTNGVPSSVILESPDVRDIVDLPEIAQLFDLPFADKSDLNLRRSWGLMQVFRSLNEDNLNRRYGFRNALYDAMLSRAAEKLPVLYDPLAYVGTTVLDLVA